MRVVKLEMFKCWPRKFSTSAFQWPIKNVRLSEQTKKIEAHWSQKLVDSFNSSKIKNAEISSLKKKYILSMFPYPSGRLHIGHMRVYTISDATARYYRLNGYEVIHPIGWDSFGLPAENAARDKHVDPREWTLKNIESMKEQLQKTRILFDWDREISTCEPEFFRWTQWIFCRLFEHGLVKRCTAEVNWDPIDKTVLAAEQIDAEGRSWRSGAMAEKKKLRQWMVETPKYAKRLQEGLEKMSNQWGEVSDIQSNWIGKCDVYRFMFPLQETTSKTILDEVLDLRIHDIHQIAQAEFVIINQSHPLVVKSGNQEYPYLLPIQVLNGVTGKWMKIVVAKNEEKPELRMYMNSRIGCFENDKDICQKLKIEQSKRKLSLNKNDIQEIAAFGGYGGYETSRTLNDWVVSRQRGWGTPIPMIMSNDGKTAKPVMDENLPVIDNDRGRLIEGEGRIDSDTLDTFFDSSWYYLRYLDSKNKKNLISISAAKKMPVDVYVGGIEHAAVHMFFARFVAYFLKDIGVIEINEPFTDLIPQGIVRGKTLVEKETRRYLSPEEVELKNKKLVLKTNENIEVEAIYEKMSKSKNNGVDLSEILETDGVDLTRLRLLESAAPRAPINWGENDLKGIKKLIDRIATIASDVIEAKQLGKLMTIDEKKEEEIREFYNFFVRNVGMCLEVLHLHNTALMRLQGFTNALKKIDPVYLANSIQGERALKSLIIMMQVFCPHISAEIWSGIGDESKLVTEQKWPEIDADAHIDFLLMIDGVSCGRPSIDRRIIEKMELNELWKRAENKEHSEMIGLLKKEKLKIKNINFTKRSGFHVTLSASLEGDKEKNRKIIGNILDNLQAQKREAFKSANGKPKKKKSKAV